MNERNTKTSQKNVSAFDDVEVEGFATRLDGEVLSSEDPDYDQARAVWNGMIDRRPGLIPGKLNPAYRPSLASFSFLISLPRSSAGALRPACRWHYSRRRVRPVARSGQLA